MGPCFRKEKSNPPTCGIHNVALVHRELPVDPYAPHLGHINGFVSPVSGQLVTDESPSE